MDNIRYREVEIGRVNTILERLARPEFKELNAFAFGSTHSSNVVRAQEKLNRAVSLLHHGSAAKGFWRLVPLPKPRSFAFKIHDNLAIPQLFSLLDEYLLISFLFVLPQDREIVEELLLGGKYDSVELIGNLTDLHILWNFDLDSSEFESGISEEFSVSEAVSKEIRSVLMI